MNQTQFDTMIRAFEASNYISPIGPIARATTFGVLEYGLKNGFFEMVEQRNPYTFGGVTIRLTDTEFAKVLSYLRDERKIQAIKALRVDYSGMAVSLREAKDFADHLGNVVSLMSST
jgi:hypothetical protein